jgi:proteic killer suppression protein
VIRSFKDKETEKVFNRQWSKKLPAGIQSRAYRKLAMVHSANKILDLQIPPGNQLEKLKGNRAGQWSIRINEQWRICFEWRDDDAYNVEVAHYHS